MPTARKVPVYLSEAERKCQEYVIIPALVSLALAIVTFLVGERFLGLVFLAVSVVAIWIVYILVRGLWGHLRSSRARGDITSISSGIPARTRRGLIAIVSGRREVEDGDPILRAAAYHSPELRHCWLLHTEEYGAKGKVLRERLVAEHKHLADNVVLMRVDSPLAHGPTKEVVDSIYARLPAGLAEEDVIADFTGGTKVMTAGMLLACLSEARGLEYVPDTTGPEGRRIPGDPLALDIVYTPPASAPAGEAQGTSVGID